jgi:hypothetical protein
VLSEFSARAVALTVIEHLERRRAAIVDDEGRVQAEVEEALAPVRTAYAEAQLPAGYLQALEGEVRTTVPAAWRRIAAPFTAAERREFGIWRGGDPIARVTYVLVGLLLGGLIVWAPFIPIWEKWFPFALAGSAWFLPTAQLRFHQRRYARALGDIAVQLERAQPLLDARITTEELLLPPGGN